MGYETIYKKLFRAPRQGALTPQEVAKRLTELLPRDQYPMAWDMAGHIAKLRRPVEWRRLAQLRTLITFDSQRRHGWNTDRFANYLIEVLEWRGSPYSDNAQTTHFQSLCSYCHRVSVRMTRYRNQKAWVCPHHLPGTKGGQQAARLKRWAGGVFALDEKVKNEAAHLREKATDQELEAVLTDLEIDDVTRAWWKQTLNLELAIRIAAHQMIEKQYRQWVDESRALGGKLGGAKGGRPKIIGDDKVSQAQLMISSGSSLRKAAKAVGISPSTLSRRLHASVQ